MILKWKHFFKVLQQFSVMVKNKIAKTDINLNFIIFIYKNKNESKSN